MIALGTVSALTLAVCNYDVGHYGGDFGLAISNAQNVAKFDSHTAAVQTLLDGKD